MEREILLRAPLFKGLDASEIATVLAGTPNKTRKYIAGSMIAQSGDIVNDLLVVVNGVVKGEMVDYAGRVIKIEDVPAPGALASAFIFGNQNRFPVNVIAVTDTELLIIERQSFLRLLMMNDKILVNFLDMISNRSQFLSEKIKFLNFRTIKGKLAQYILNLPVSAQKQVRLDRTQNDLADFFGVTRPSIARALGEMEALGLIKAEGKTISITDFRKLAALTTD
jgi:CRP/FNR family transcriptional regulator, dissimilatory nitrate respiration regulator